MNYMTTAYTDVGTRKNTNQDCCTIKVMKTPTGSAFFAVLCDGMGGLEKGELASATVLKAFSDWFLYSFPNLHMSNAAADDYYESWDNVVNRTNEIVMNYSASTQTRMGTTLAAILGVDDKYFVVNIGDSRVYRIGQNIELLTKDHSFVAQEVEQHRMTEEEARLSPKRSVLLQCVGASNVIKPYYASGNIYPNEVYMLCSDGFRNAVLSSELFQGLHPNILLNEEAMMRQSKMLVDLNIAREESDNITVALVRTLL